MSLKNTPPKGDGLAAVPFFCPSAPVQQEGDDEPSRMYIHR